MIVDSSALVAILLNEEDGDSLSRILDGAEIVRMSAASYFETSIVVDHYRDPALSARLDETILEAEIAIERSRRNRRALRGRPTATTARAAGTRRN